jgi:uncharacterized repeat protein (TIGR01451 family)
MELRNSGLITRRLSLFTKTRVRLGWLITLIVLAAFGIAVLLPASSASSSGRKMGLTKTTKATAHSAAPMSLSPLDETIMTFAANCTTPKTSFNLGDTVCAIVTGAPSGRRFQWANTVPFVIRQNDIIGDTQADAFTLPTANTSVVNGLTIDNRGTWSVNSMDTSDGSLRASVTFTVHDPAAAAVDLEVSNVARPDSSTPAANSDVVFVVTVRNNGPDDAAATSLTNAVPANTTFVSATEDSGPAFNCSNPAVGGGGTSTCTLASFAAGAEASFSFKYHVDGSAPDGTELSDTVSIGSTTADRDTTNNSSTATADVTTPTCTIFPPADITQPNDFDAQGHALGGAVVTYSDPTTSSSSNPSSCGTVECSPLSGSFFPVGVNVVTCSDTINAPVHFNVTVQDTEGPTITCPANVTAPESSHGSGSAIVNFPAPTATDNSGFVTVTTNPVNGSSFPVGTTTVTATATDAAGHTATCTFTVTVVPSDCAITCPASITQAPDPGQNGAIVNYPPATTTGTTCGTVTYSVASGSFFPLGTTTVTATAAGGETCSFTVTVTTDTTPPTISCPADIVQAAPAGTCQATVNPGTPTASDNNPGVTVTSTRSDGQPANAPFPVGETIITWTATDAAGNTATCDQSVKVTENVPPSITPPAPVTVNVNATCDDVAVPNFLNGLVVSDNCTPSANLELTQDPAAETTIGVGSHTVTITAKDVSGNIGTTTTTFNVVDNIPPTITLNGASSVTVECHTSFTDPGATAHDACAGNFAATASGNLGINTPGTYTITYNASDPSGNAATPVTRTVHVVDTTPPVVTAPAGVTVFTGPGAVICGTVVGDGTLGIATASDSCQGSLTVGRTGVPAGNVFPVGQTTITYSAADASGNMASATQVVTVVDNTPPTISCQADIVTDFDPAVNGATVNYTAPVGSDNCPGAVTTQIAGLPSGSTFPLGTTTNTFKVTDSAGLTTQCSFKVTVGVTSIIGLDSVSITGSGLVDSYDSNGGYPATKGSLANVLSNGTITLGGSGKLFGNVRSTRAGVAMSGAFQVTGNATAGTTVSKTGSAVVNGTTTNNLLAPVMTLPSVVACGPPYSPNTGISGTYTYSAGTGDLTLSGVNIATLANGTYCFHNITMTNSAQLKVNGPVVIKLTGALNVSGATSLTNTTSIPGNLRILSSFSGANGISLTNSTSAFLLIYAPNTGATISGAVPLFGTVVGKSITISNSGMIHYDTRLQSIWPALWPLILGN